MDRQRERDAEIAEQLLGEFRRRSVSVLRGRGAVTPIDGLTVLTPPGCDFAIRPWALTPTGSEPLPLIRVAKVFPSGARVEVQDVHGHRFTFERIDNPKHRKLYESVRRWRSLGRAA
jgi:hypothetical protein